MVDGANERSDFLSPSEMGRLLEEEICAQSKASELRIREFSQFVIAYAAGELTPEQADQKLTQYRTRWGEALPGVFSAQGMTDDEILATIDDSRSPDFVDRLLKKHGNANTRRDSTASR